MKYSIINNGDRASVQVFLNGKILTADELHPNFRTISALLLVEGDKVNQEQLEVLFDPAEVVEARFNSITDRVQVKNGQIYFDGEVINNSLTDHIIRSMRAGYRDFTPFVNFLVRVSSNPTKQSRDNLFDWLRAENFTLNRNGCIIGYKGLDADHRSIHSGPATVDGVQMNGKIPNALGAVIEMPRLDVTLDPATGCSRGLHVGTYEYARGFGHVVVEVVVDPADVVSVPTDCHGQKMRVCRYMVGAVVTEKNGNPLDYDPEDDDCCNDDDCVDCHM